MITFTSLFIFSGVSIIVSVFTSLVILYFSFSREGRQSHKTVLRQWALAFLLFSWLRLPVVWVAAGGTIVVIDLVPFYAGTNILFFVALYFFWRGAMQFFTPNMFWQKIFPVFLFGILWAITNVIYFVLHVGAAIVAILVFSLLALIGFFVIAATLRYMKQLDHSSLAPVARVGAWIFIAGWVIFSVSHYYVVVALFRYPPEVWFVAHVTNLWVYFGFAVAHFLFVAGLYLAGFHKDIIPVSREKRI